MEKKCFLCTIKHYAKPYKDRRRLSRNTARDATYLLVTIEKQKLIDEISARRFVTEAPLSLSQVCGFLPPPDAEAGKLLPDCSRPRCHLRLRSHRKAQCSHITAREASLTRPRSPFVGEIARKEQKPFRLLRCARYSIEKQYNN